MIRTLLPNWRLTVFKRDETQKRLKVWRASVRPFSSLREVVILVEVEKKDGKCYIGNQFDVGVRALKSIKNNANILALIAAWECVNALFKVENLEEESV